MFKIPEKTIKYVKELSTRSDQRR